MGGGGGSSYPQLRHNLLSAKDCSNAGEVLHTAPHYANYGTKTRYKKTPRTTQIMLWLLVFSIFIVFSLCPLASFATRYNLTAGGLSDGTFYVGAPVFVAGDTNRSATTGSANTSTGVLNDTATNKPLFKTDGTVDTTVLKDLLSMLDDNKVKENPIGTSGVKYYSAKNFGKYGTQNRWANDQKGNAQILVKLFEDTTDTTNGANVATAQYWQAVYRSINGENDVLTLYMCRPYTNAQFNPSSDTEYNNKTYRSEGNYSQSYLRDKTVLPLYDTLKATYKTAEDVCTFDKYVVAPYQLTSGASASDMSKTTVENGTYLNLGGWQSSKYQTSYNKDLALYNNKTNINDALGSSGYRENSSDYSLENGMDGLSVAYIGWSGKVESAYVDKLWVPSEFEVLHTGYGSSNAVAEGGTTGRKVENGKYYDVGNAIVKLQYPPTVGAFPSNSNSNANRTGLWELNGYDRASSHWSWTRSSLSTGRHVCDVGVNGNYGADPVHQVEAGVRVALHLNLGALKSLFATKLNITAKNNAVNSLLVLTIMDGDARLAEYSCISGTITPQITFDWNKTYKILATRPFGSRLEVKLDNVLQSPTNFACYKISTADNAQMNISFTLTGDGSWKNCVVV